MYAGKHSIYDSIHSVNTNKELVSLSVQNTVVNILNHIVYAIYASKLFTSLVYTDYLLVNKVGVNDSKKTVQSNKHQ